MRAQFLDRACAEDQTVRQGLAALLAVHEQPDTLLATQAAAALPGRRFDGIDSPLLLVIKPTNVVLSVTFRPDGRRIVTGIAAGATARVWYAGTPPQVSQGPGRLRFDVKKKPHTFSESIAHVLAGVQSH